MLLSAVFACSAAGTPAARLHGIIWLAGITDRFGDAAAMTRHLPFISGTLASNTYIDGVYIALRWDDFEPTRGDYAWDRLDSVIDCVRKAGRFYKLVLDPGVDTPDYVYGEGAAAFAISDEEQSKQPGKKQNREDRIPLPWDPVFRTNFVRVLTAIADRYGHDEQFAATAITGVSHRYSETHLPKNAAQWKKYDNVESKVRESLIYYVDLFAALFPRQALCFEIAVPFSGMETALRDSVAYAVQHYPSSVSLQNNQLNGKGDNMRNPTYRIICEYKDRVKNGFQNVSCLTPPCSAADGRQGDMMQTVSNYVNADAEYLEVWYIDGATAATSKALKDAITAAYAAKKR
ncbi:MAG: beta-galactosidase [Spirochaetes bacterium]|nr:beta-galactosidase [Spirochaetota bacterium]